VVLPNKVTLTLGGSTSGVQFCSYHAGTDFSPGVKLLDVPIPYMGPGTSGYAGCGSLPNDTDNQTVVMTHEIAETLNDPLAWKAVSADDGNISWYDTSSGEIGDICNAQSSANNGFYVQKEWSVATASCLGTGSNLFAQPTTDFAAPTAQATVSAPFSATGSTSSTNHSVTTTYQAVNYTVPAGMADWTWDFGDGSSGSGQSTAHTFAAPGTSNVTLTARDNLGFVARATHVASIGDAPSPPPPPVTDTQPPTVTPPVDARPPLPILQIVQAPKLKLVKRNLTLDTGRTATCPAGSETCVVQVTVSAATSARALAARNYGRTTIRIAPGHTAKIVVKLSAAVRKLARKGRVKLTVALLRQRGNAPQKPTAFKLTLKLPKSA
jgi:hypothetical protein